MRFIPTGVHGFLDYAVGVLLVAAPWLLGFAKGGAETWTPVALGAAALVYSFFTDYERGVIRRIPMNVHLGLDIATGVLLALSPWLFGFSTYVRAPHVFVGLFVIAAGMFTQQKPSWQGGLPSRLAPS